MMAMTDTPDAEPPHADPAGPPATVLEVQGHEYIGHRCFTPNVLREIDALLREGPFDEARWEITDQQGVHRSADIDALLNTVLWPSVECFQVECYRHFLERNPSLPLTPPVPSNRIWVWAWTHSDTEANWSSAPENRQPVEFTFSRLYYLLRRLPESHASRPAFVEAPPVEPTKAWRNARRIRRSIVDWLLSALFADQVIALAKVGVALLARSLLRAPRSILDWILVGVLGGLAVAAVVAVVALLAQSL